MKNILFALLVFCTISLWAAPYNGNIVTFRQPDGSKVEIKLFGDEFYLRAESMDGYTLIRDNSTGWICYAILTEDKNGLVSSGQVYSGGMTKTKTISGLKLTQHLDNSPEAIRKIQQENKQKLLGKKEFNNTDNLVSGNIKGICIVVDFSDEPGSLPMSEFSSFCNDMNYTNFGNNGSLRTFYSDISGGLVDYENIVYGYYRAPNTFDYYDQLPFADGAQEVLGLALDWVAAQGFDFSTLSTNPDGSIMAINLMYTGNPLGWSQGMWYHMGSYTGFSANGVHSDSYNCSPANSPLELSVVAHENGHMIGKWPDTYKYNSSTGPDGIGAFDLMCWYGDSHNPVPPNPFFRSSAGWGNVVDVTYYNGIISDTAGSLTCYKYRNVNDTNEFFLLENREMTGRSQYIPDEGLTIWQIDKLGDNQSTHHQVYLEHANNDIWNHNNACFHQGFNAEFSLNTTPDSRWYNNDPSGLRVWEIGPVNHIMHYKLGAGVAAPVFNLNWVNISGDDNANGFLEPAENGFMNVNAANFGQIASASATITCTLLGPPTAWVTINNPSITLGTIGVGQTLPAAFQVQISPSTPLGTQLQFRFEISDGTYSTFVTRLIIIGWQININNQFITSCSALFYDHGGPFGNYANMTDYYTTVFPGNSAQKVKVNFTSFDLEDEPNCIYDWLKIYDGPGFTSPLLGMWCGSNSPGTLTSTDASGALTFEFHSDEGLTASGWEAILSCTGSIGIQSAKDDFRVQIQPNPSSGLFTLTTPAGKQAEIEVLTLQGSLLYRGKTELNGNTAMDLSDLAKGIYLLKVKYSDTLISRKLIIGSN